MKNEFPILIIAIISGLITIIIFLFIISPLFPGVIKNRIGLKILIIVIWGGVYFVSLVIKYFFKK
jgi:hypothetical protein